MQNQFLFDFFQFVQNNITFVPKLTSEQKSAPRLLRYGLLRFGHLGSGHLISGRLRLGLLGSGHLISGRLRLGLLGSGHLRSGLLRFGHFIYSKFEFLLFWNFWINCITVHLKHHHRHFWGRKMCTLFKCLGEKRIATAHTTPTKMSQILDRLSHQQWLLIDDMSKKKWRMFQSGPPYYFNHYHFCGIFVTQQKSSLFFDIFQPRTNICCEPIYGLWRPPQIHCVLMWQCPKMQTWEHTDFNYISITKLKILLAF